MAKKPSRATRKQIRERHERAQAHGLPGRALERPSKPAPASSFVDFSSTGDAAIPSRMPMHPNASETGIVETRDSFLLDKLKALPLAAKLGALVVPGAGRDRDRGEPAQALKLEQANQVPVRQLPL